MSNKKSYVYIHIRLDNNEVFYVGVEKKDSIETRKKKSISMLGNKRGVGVKHSKESIEKAIAKHKKKKGVKK